MHRDESPPGTHSGKNASVAILPSQKATGSSNPKDRRSSAVSCAECRRSKLKCDRNVPCQACVRRGCAALCPDGTLNATKGNKILQSRVDKLNDEVSTMTAKIKALESALAAARTQLGASTDSTEEGAGREPDCKRAIRRRPYGNGSGTLAMNGEGVSSYHGDTAQPEYLSGLIPGNSLAVVCWLPNIQELGLPLEMIELFNAFPFGMRERLHNKSLFLPFIPSLERALQLTENHYQRFAWMFLGISREDFSKEILHRIYGASKLPAVDCIHPHRLAVFFAVMAIGASLSFEQTATQQGGKYYVLACSALSLAPVIAEAMVPTIQALFLINVFLHSSNRISVEECWLLTGLCGRLVFRTGLHRDGAQLNLGKDETQRRRLLFWELYRWDAWFSYVTGRSPSIHLPDTDTRFPEDFQDSGIAGFFAWKHRYTAACFWPSVRLSCAKEVSYQAIMNLDKKIRTFPIPTHLQPPVRNHAWSDDPASAMQQYCMMWVKELNLLFLHRNYLAVALRTQRQNPISHKFGGSVMATFRSVLRLCSCLKDIYELHPNIVSRIWFFWSGIFSACIALSAIVIVSPMCDLAETALKELRAAIDLFERGSELCRHPKSLYLLKILWRQAEDSYASYIEDPANFPAIEARIPKSPDELMILGGVAHGVIPYPAVPEPTSPVCPVAPISAVHTQTSLGDLRSEPSPPISYEPVVLYNANTMPAPTSLAEFDAVFSPSDFVFPSASSVLPTYEDIMNVPNVGIALGPDQSYSSFLRSVSGYSEPPSSLADAFGTFGPYQHVASPDMLPGEGGSHDDIWRSFIDGLTNGQGPFAGDSFF